MARYNDVQVGAYPFYSAASAGGVSYPAFPLVNDAPGQLQPNAPAHMGDAVIDKFGNVYLYVRAIAALAVGQVCMVAAPSSGTVSATSTGIDNKSIIASNITTTIDESTVGSFIINCNVTRPGTRLIKGQVAVGTNTKFVISKKQTFFGTGSYDGDKLATAWVSTDACAVHRPYTVDVCGAGNIPVGVALGSVTAGYRTLIQVSGLAQVLGVGTTDALAVGGPVFTIAAGEVKGVLGTPTATEAEKYSVVGYALQVYAGASSLQAIQLCNLADKW